ncbi:MAG: hypothetical protein IID42_10945 [Planctomycetes bacterium]|nr:hypothetical protein [Planctomycetota bacterium]
MKMHDTIVYMTLSNGGRYNSVPHPAPITLNTEWTHPAAQGTPAKWGASRLRV